MTDLAGMNEREFCPLTGVEIGDLHIVVYGDVVDSVFVLMVRLTTSLVKIRLGCMNCLVRTGADLGSGVMKRPACLLTNAGPMISIASVIEE